MLFLIDYENVGIAGMKGCDYLDGFPGSPPHR